MCVGFAINGGFPMQIEDASLKPRELTESPSCDSGDMGFCHCHSVVGVMNFLITTGACGVRFEFRNGV